MKTVKVRVAVAVDHNGYWNSSGWKDSDGEELLFIAEELLFIADPLEGAYAIHYLTAELPVPEPQEIAAEVELQK